MKTKTYFGFSGDSEFLHYSWSQFVDYSVGRIILSIGNGSFRDATMMVLSQAAAWGMYHDKDVKKWVLMQGDR